MKRFVWAAFAVGALAMATGCQPVPPPPPAYQAPVITATAVSPDPAAPGDDVVIVVDVSDDEVVSDVTLGNLITPTGRALPGLSPCSSVLEQSGVPGIATATITCALPTWASNGTWNVEVNVADRPASTQYSYPGLRNVRLPFVVSGGVDDRSGPQLVEFVTNPAEPRHDAPFTLTLRLSDQASPSVMTNSWVMFSKPFSPSTVECLQPVTTQVSPTLTEVTLTCTPGWTEPGIHFAAPTVRDALGNERNVEVVFTLG